MKSNERSASGTLLMSVVMSAPGPLIVGLGLLTGKSTTQTADFVRRSAELLGIIMAYLTYRTTTRGGIGNSERRQKLERRSNRFVGAMMLLGGIIMLWLALTSESGDKGNVIPGIVIALLGVTANTIFCVRYTRMNRLEPNPIVAVQSRLYFAKSLVDGCVTAALLTVVIAPGTTAATMLDLIGSIIVALYLVFCGARTVLENIKNK